MSAHTCIKDDGGTPNRRCQACENEKVQVTEVAVPAGAPVVPAAKEVTRLVTPAMLQLSVPSHIRDVPCVVVTTFLEAWRLLKADGLLDGNLEVRLTSRKRLNK